MLRSDPYTTFLFLGGALALGVAVYVLFRRFSRGQGTTAFAGLLTASASWNIGYAFELSSHTLGEMLFWMRFEFLGIATCPVFWLLFALAWSGKLHWISTRTVAVFFLFPVLTIFFVWVDPAGGWVYEKAEIISGGRLPILKLTPGPWYYANTIYSYAVVLAGAVVLWKPARSAGEPLRSQAILLIVAAVLPTGANILYRNGFRLGDGIDPTPFALLLTCFAIGWSLSYRGLFSVRPVARDTVIERMADAVFVFDENGWLIDSNVAAKSLMPLSRGSNIRTLLAAWPSIAEAATKLPPSETQSLRKEAVISWNQSVFEVQISRPNPLPGASPFTLMIWRDITDRQRSEEALRLSEGVLSNLVCNSPMGIYFYDVDKDGRLRLVGWNPAADHSLKTDTSRLAGLEITEAFPALKDTPLPEKFKSIALSGGTWESDWVDYDEGQVCRAFEVRAFQTSPGKMVVFFYDISARKKAENKLEHARRFERLLIEISSRFVHVPFELLDSAMAKALEEVGRFCGMDRSSLFICDEENAHLPRKILEWCSPELLASEVKPPGVTSEFFSELMARLRGGEPWFFPDPGVLPINQDREALEKQGIKSLFLVPLLENAELLGFISLESVRKQHQWGDGFYGPLKILADLLTNAIARKRVENQRLKIEEERRAMERKFLQSQKLESLGLLAGGVAHDFNNLLAAILGNLDIAEAALKPGHLALRYLENGRRAAQRASDLTQQMLAYSGKGRLVTGPVDLNSLIAEYAAILSATVHKTTKLRVFTAPQLPLIIGDAGQIQQVIMNLLINASESLRGAPGEVDMETYTINADERLLSRSRLQEKPHPGNFVCVSVRDNGCGMNEETIERIFEPFFTTKFTGRGLGMSAVLGIVQAHKGALLIDSKPGSGTKIQVLFPAATMPDVSTNEANADATNLSETSAEQSSRATKSMCTVWVVDDEEAVRSVCCEGLKLAGIDALPCESGRQMLSLLDAGQRPACILLDLTMPEMDGPAVVEQLAKRSFQPPVLIISGYGEEETLNQLAGQSVAGFLKKPFTIAELAKKVREILSA